MIAGVDYVFAHKNEHGMVRMYIDEECTKPYVNAVLYDKVCDWASQFLQEGQVEAYYI